MESGGFVLLLIVAVCVVALIYISKKRKELDEESVSVITDVSGSSGTSGTTSGTGSTTSTTHDAPKEEAKTSAPPQNTIYEYHAKNANRLCPFCDGENSGSARVCNICGRDL